MEILFLSLIIYLWFAGTVASTIAVLSMVLRIVWFPFNVYEDWEEFKEAMFNTGALFWVIIFVVGWGVTFILWK